MIRLYKKREALASSRIDGTRAELSDLLMDEIQPGKTPLGSDLFEVRNYAMAMDHGISNLT